MFQVAVEDATISVDRICCLRKVRGKTLLVSLPRTSPQKYLLPYRDQLSSQGTLYRVLLSPKSGKATIFCSSCLGGMIDQNFSASSVRENSHRHLHLGVPTSEGGRSPQRFCQTLRSARRPGRSLVCSRSQPIRRACTAVFRPERLMYGSDWPVSLLRGG